MNIHYFDHDLLIWYSNNLYPHKKCSGFSFLFITEIHPVLRGWEFIRVENFITKMAPAPVPTVGRSAANCPVHLVPPRRAAQFLHSRPRFWERLILSMKKQNSMNISIINVIYCNCMGKKNLEGNAWTHNVYLYTPMQTEYSVEAQHPPLSHMCGCPRNKRLDSY